jgi:ABC-type multidrug transport system ATPase subunit
MSIHQPRYSIFKLFDTLTLLSLGSMVYHGQAGEALEYFDRSLGEPLWTFRPSDKSCVKEKHFKHAVLGGYSAV